MDKTQINLERMRANDADWEEQKHPRAENGQFTSGSGSAGGASKPSAEPAASSPLKKAAAAVNGEKAAAAPVDKADRKYTGQGTQSEEDAKIRNDPRYIGNKAMEKLLGGDMGVAYFRFVKPLNARGHIDNPNEIRVEFGQKWLDNGIVKTSRVSTFFDADKILKPENASAPAQPPAPKKAAAPKKSNVLTGYKGKTYTQGITGAAANTPAGEVHNLIAGRIESTNPTKAEIAEAAWYIADENLNDEVRHCREMVQEFERDGNDYAAKAWRRSLKRAQKKEQLCKEIAKSMSAKDSASPLQQAAAILQSE